MRIFKAVIKRLISLIKLLSIKIIHFKKFRFIPLGVISYSTKFRFNKSGEIILGKKIGTRKNVEFSVGENGKISVGDGCFFNNNCMIVSHDKIKIGRNCSFGPNVLFYDHDHNYKAFNGLKSESYVKNPIVIGDNVWIGANSVILRGSEIGDNCVIGAGSIVKGKFESNTMIVMERKMKVEKYSFDRY